MYRLMTVPDHMLKGKRGCLVDKDKFLGAEIKSIRWTPLFTWCGACQEGCYGSEFFFQYSNSSTCGNCCMKYCSGICVEEVTITIPDALPVHESTAPVSKNTIGDTDAAAAQAAAKRT
jgi:hypothetical protein